MKQETLDAMRAWLDGKDVQELVGEVWRSLGRHDQDYIKTSVFKDSIEYRIAPRTISIGGYHVPEPIRVTPPMGAKYYRPCISSDRTTATTHIWANRAFDKWALSSGLVHYDIDAAFLHADALASLTRDMACHPKP